MHNPSLRSEPISQKSTAALTNPQDSMLDWLEKSGRLLARENQDRELLPEEDEMEEISDFIIGDEDGDFDEEDADLED
jgi:hypothetical protein